VYKVHVRGAFKVTKAAWPYMRDQGYGRIIMTASAAGIYGNRGQANYSSAKLALYAFGRTLAVEGEARNILVNTIAPVAGSRMTATVMPEDMVKALKPDYVAPLVAWLCHEDSKVNGELFEVGGGWVSQLRWQRTKGAFFPIDKGLTPEAIQGAWGVITDWSEHTFPKTPDDSIMSVMSNLQNKGSNANFPQKVSPSGSQPSTGGDVAGFNASKVFDEISKKIIADGPNLVKKVGGVYEFVITNGPGGKSQTWGVDLAHGNGSVAVGKPADAGVTITMTDDDFVAMMTGKLNSQQAFMQGKLKIGGNMALAMKLQVLTQAQSKL